MKGFFKYCFILLTFIGFLFSTFELNKEEFKHNFKKEDHTYITTAKTVSGHDFHLDHPVALPVNPIRLIVEEKFIQEPRAYHFFTNPDPPPKLYIRNSVFRI